MWLWQEEGRQRVMEPVMAKAMAEADLSIFLAKTFCDTTFFLPLTTFV
jgi:hypothetical protein